MTDKIKRDLASPEGPHSYSCHCDSCMGIPTKKGVINMPENQELTTICKCDLCDTHRGEERRIRRHETN